MRTSVTHTLGEIYVPSLWSKLTKRLQHQHWAMCVGEGREGNKEAIFGVSLSERSVKQGRQNRWSGMWLGAELMLKSFFRVCLIGIALTVCLGPCGLLSYSGQMADLILCASCSSFSILSWIAITLLWNSNWCQMSHIAGNHLIHFLLGKTSRDARRMHVNGVSLFEREPWQT